jgi:hypothetical protein
MLLNKKVIGFMVTFSWMSIPLNYFILAFTVS